MLFISYWELNENMSENDRLQVAQKLINAVPPEIKILRWDVTPDAWGITVFEADRPIDAFKFFALWRTKSGFFKSVKTSPAIPTEEAIPQMGEYLKSLGK
jgi:hypothetical protein